MAKARAQASREQLTVQRRMVTGTRPARRLRETGAVPGVVYGKGMEALSVAVNQRELTKLLRSKRGEHALVTLRLDGPASWDKSVLVKEVQHDPVDGRVVHVDFQAIVLTERLRVKIPVVLKGEPVGVKQEGGILEHFLREVEIECLPTEIPVSVEFDVSRLKIGDTVHVRDLAAPANADITSDTEGVIASVQKPKEEKPEEAAAAVTEPEVLREKKEEGEAAPGAEAKGEAPEAKKEKDQGGKKE
jgi:large subunit ribosomal protein L25